MCLKAGFGQEIIQIDQFVISAQNTLRDEITHLGSPMCRIEVVPNLINEMHLNNIELIHNPIIATNKIVNQYGGTGFLPEEGFTYLGSYVLGTAVFTTVADEMKNQKQWLAAGPRRHLFFQP